MVEHDGEHTKTMLEFLQDRLAEDELTALAAVDGAPYWRSNYQYRDVKDQDGHYVVQADSRYPSIGQAAHIARHSPARVLADVEAKRAVLSEYLRLDAAGDVLARGIVEDILRAMCRVYAEHSDYRASWA